MTDNYTRGITVTRVIDGDTFVANTDLGYHVTMVAVTYRVLRVNCPEMTGPGRLAGQEAKAYTAAWLVAHAAHDGLSAVSVKSDDWRRYLAEIVCGWQHNLSDDLMSTGHAMPYLGG